MRSFLSFVIFTGFLSLFTATQSHALNLDSVAKELKIKKELLPRKALILKRLYSQERLFKKVCSEDFQKNTSLCLLASEIKGYDPKQMGLSNKRHSTRITKKNIAKLQNESYKSLRNRVERIPAHTILTLVPSIIKHKACPRNFSAASIRALEDLLPSRNAKINMERLYRHASHCLKDGDNLYGKIHLRQALLRKLWSYKAWSEYSISRTLLESSKENIDQKLFWSGLISSNNHLTNIYWKQLARRYPLSYYTLEAAKQGDEKFFKFYAGRKDLIPERYLEDSDSLAQEALHWVEAFYLLGHDKEAKETAEKMVHVFRPFLKSENLLYLAELIKTHGHPNEKKKFLKRNAKKYLGLVKEDTLKNFYPRPYRKHFYSQKNVNPHLLFAVAKQESSFNPKAMSPAVALGLLQILPSTALTMTRNKPVNLFNPQTNIHIGSKYLKKLLKKYKKATLALAAYNAGPSRVNEWTRRYPTNNELLFVDLIPFKETQNYVKSVLSNYYWYQKLYDSSPTPRALEKIQVRAR